MPTYDYECKKCKAKGELTAPMRSVPAYKKCPKCGGRMIRQFSIPTIVFKGDDWPGQNIKKKHEDKEIKRKVRKAKELKQTGKIKMEEVIRLESPCLQEGKKYKGRDK